MDNPTQLIHVGRSFFRSECLGAIPLDIKTTRNFIQGEIPDVSSLFARHVFSIIPKLGINVDKYKSINVFSPNEYNYTSTKDPSLTIGGIVSVLILLYFGIILSFTSIMDTYLDIIGIEGDINRDRFAIASIIIAAIFLSADVVKIFLGKVFVTYMKLFRAIIGSQK